MKTQPARQLAPPPKLQPATRKVLAARRVTAAPSLRRTWPHPLRRPPSCPPRRRFSPLPRLRRLRQEAHQRARRPAVNQWPPHRRCRRPRHLSLTSPCRQAVMRRTFRNPANRRVAQPALRPRPRRPRTPPRRPQRHLECLQHFSPQHLGRRRRRPAPQSRRLRFRALYPPRLLLPRVRRPRRRTSRRRQRPRRSSLRHSFRLPRATAPASSRSGSSRRRSARSRSASLCRRMGRLVCRSLRRSRKHCCSWCAISRSCNRRSDMRESRWMHGI